MVRERPQAFERSGAKPRAMKGQRVTDTLPVEADNRKDVRPLTLSLRPKGRSGLSSPRGAISVRGSKPPYTSGRWIDEAHRRERLSPVRLEWETRATRLNREISESSTLEPSELDELKRRRAYAVARVARLTADIAPRLESCGDESIPIVCGCGPVGAKKTCRQWWLCGPCRAKRTPSLSHDIRKGLAAALSRELESWGAGGGRGQEPRIILLTFTAAHTGDLRHDQGVIADGWRALYKRLNEDNGKFPYVGVWEVTPGTDRLGHVHLHVAAIWRYRDWWRIRAQWESACPSSMYLDIKRRRKDGKESSPSSVAKYLGKYLSKGADLGEFDGRLRAEVSAAFYNRHSILCSEGFWQRVTKCCQKCSERYRLAVSVVECETWIACAQSAAHPMGWRRGWLWELTEPIPEPPRIAAQLGLHGI